MNLNIVFVYIPIPYFFKQSVAVEKSTNSICIYQLCVSWASNIHHVHAHKHTRMYATLPTSQLASINNQHSHQTVNHTL